jgi:cytochrome c oxidase assembly protein subunit 15
MSPRILRAYKWLVLGILGLIAFGGSVRAMNAGLACPDWPLCYGDVIPDYHPQVYFEFIHRALAGFDTITLLILNILVLRSKKVSRGIKWLAIFSWVLLLAQIVMGGLTVLWQLKESVVTIHLALGTALFATLLTIYMGLKRASGPDEFAGERLESQQLGLFPMVLMAASYGQIILGGLVASHYAGNVCPEFPLCHGELVPTLRGPIGLQVIHRLGAYTLFTLGVLYLIFVFLRTQNHFWRQNALYFMSLLMLQLCVGVANVLFGTPPLITVLHLFIGTSLLGIATRMAVVAYRPPLAQLLEPNLRSVVHLP